MDERMIQIQELQKLREELLKEESQKQENQNNQPTNEQNNNNNNNQNMSNQKGSYQLVKANPSVPSLLDKTGFSNVIYLAAISLLSEVVFLAIAFMIYN